MFKKISRYAFAGILFLMTVFGIKTVNAEQYTGQAIWPSEFIPNIYIKKVQPNGYTKYQQAQFIRRSEDNKFVYCVQPYTGIDNNLPYYNVARDDYAKALNFTDNVLNFVMDAGDRSFYEATFTNSLNNQLV